MNMAAAGDANADAKIVREITEQDSRRVYRLLADGTASMPRLCSPM